MGEEKERIVSGIMKFNIEIKCAKKSRVTEEKLYGYIIRSIAGVVANNNGIITTMSCDTEKHNEEEEGEK